MKLRCCACGGLEFIFILVLLPLFKLVKKKWNEHHDRCNKCSCKSRKNSSDRS